MTSPRTIDLEIAVSWSGDGVFDGLDDDVTNDADANAGLSLDDWRDGAQQLNPPKIAAGGFSLLNHDGVYSQNRADSPIYQRVVPTRPVRYQAARGETRSYRSSKAYGSHGYYRGRGVYQLGRHLLDDLDQNAEIGQQRVSVSTLGYETVLTRAPVTVALMTAPRVDQCVTALLDASGWPSDKRAVSISDTTLLLWWCDERNPWDALLELLASEGPGAMYVTGDGVFHFENRNYRGTTTRSTESQATFRDLGFGNGTRYRSQRPYHHASPYRGRSYWFTRLRPISPFKSLYNRATYTTRRRADPTSVMLQPIWDYGATLTLTSDQTRTLFVRPTDPFVEAVEPVASTDYTITSGSASVTLTYTSGFLAIITIVAGGSGAVIDGVTSTGLQLRAKPLAIVSETTVQNGVDASSSIAAYSPIPGASTPITLALNGWPEIDPAGAEAVCDAWVVRYMTPRPQLELTLSNGDGPNLEQMLSLQPSDRITVKDSNTGLNTDFWVNSRKLAISGAGGVNVEAVLGCEQSDDLTGAVWDVSEWDAVDAVWGI